MSRGIAGAALASRPASQARQTTATLHVQSPATKLLITRKASISGSTIKILYISGGPIAYSRDLENAGLAEPCVEKSPRRDCRFPSEHCFYRNLTLWTYNIRFSSMPIRDEFCHCQSHCIHATIAYLLCSVPVKEKQRSPTGVWQVVSIPTMPRLSQRS